MTPSFKTNIILALVLTSTILESDTQRVILREPGLPIPGKKTKSMRWLANNAMDMFYGNKSLIDFLAHEYGNGMYKLMSRHLRSPRKKFRPPKKNEKVESLPGVEEDSVKRASRVEINFFNHYNETIHTISLELMKKTRNMSIEDFKALEPLMGDDRAEGYV